LDTLPDLPYELVDITNYYRKGYDERVVSVMTSRGCPHNCAFCYCPATSRRLWRKMTVEKAVNVIRTAIEKFNPGYICILDDDFFVDLERAKRIIYEIKKFGWKVKFDFRGVRIDDLYRLDDTTLSLLEEIGTRNLHIGAESGSQRMLNLMKKGIQVSQTVIVNQRLRSFPSLRPTYNFFSGLPTETEEDIFKSTDLVFQLLRENPHCHMTLFNQFTPYPGSELFEMSMRYGYKPPKTLRDWGDFGPENSARIMPWLSRRMVKLLDTLYITCFFIDKKLDIHFVSNKFTFQLLKVLIRIYRPFARMRFKKHLTVLPLEVFLRDIFFSFLKRKTEYEAEGYFKAYFKFDPSRIKIWREIAKYLNKNFIKPDSRILDLGAGYCDFINNIKAKEKYALDIFSGIDKFAAKDVHLFKQTANEKIDLASDYLDVVFSSNFFEHLNPVELDRIFAEVRRVLRNNGLLIIIQPNYRYFTRQYFQDPTHKQTFDESSLASFLQQRGFQVIKNVARFLPASFKSFLPKNQFLCRLYLNSPIKPFAKQFFIVASNLKS
jgi:SAM-dependent methyltransferase